MLKIVTLYRPTGPAELELVKKSGFKRWPPRLPEQPIFYPVCNQAYAEQIAKDWNVKESGVGYVTQFEVDAEYLSCYEIKVVGSKQHAEYWIPAEELEIFNDNIIGQISIIKTFGEEG